ncbi:MAG: aminotransferase [Bacteroides sp.]|nr:aminotransferase [Bacteroides sp.]
MKERILLCKPHLCGREINYVLKAFEGDWVVPLGPDVNAFEKDLERLVGGDKRVVALACGTAAIHLALIMCGVAPGDEVMVQSFTFCASTNPVGYLGAVPVFVDSERQTWNMDPVLLDKAIADRIAVTGRKPKAIIPVYLYGMPADIDGIMDVSRKYDIPVIEDSAEAFGSRYCGRFCGSFGKYGIMSFNGNKMITTSGGGALVCPDSSTAERVMFYATQARESYPYYQHECLGYNYRLSNISAAIGRGQMEVLDEHLAHHRHLHALYRDLFAEIPGITVHDNPDDRFDSNFWLTTVTIDPSVRIRGMERAYAEVVGGAIGGAGGVTHRASSPHTASEPAVNVEGLRLYLNDLDIESRPLWKPMHLQPLWKNSPAYVNGVSESLFRCGLCLPSGPWVTDDQVRFIVKSIREAIV